jgi:hypothetical protein
MMKKIFWMFLGALALYAAACDNGTETGSSRDYFAYGLIDTILVNDTIQNDALARVVSVRSGYCLFERLESREVGDTLEVAALYHCKVLSGPCVPPAPNRPDTTTYSLHFSAGGIHYLFYRSIEGIRIIQPVYVEK